MIDAIDASSMLQGKEIHFNYLRKKNFHHIAMQMRDIGYYKGDSEIKHCVRVILDVR